MFGLSVGLHSSFSFGEESETIYESEVTIIGSERALQLSEGSTDRIDSDAITRFESSDLNDVLASTPGVYIREEDGFGLRPNIGLRGTDPDRSAKISLMEDGILIGPAPYAAPAAYYVPNVSRMRAVEVVKGAEAARFGPHNVGGAINFITQSYDDLALQNPNREDRKPLLGELSLTAGSFDSYLAETRLGTKPFLREQNDRSTAIVFDGLYFGSQGFKDIDGSTRSTGFSRSDSNLRIAHQFDDRLDQKITMKLGYANEDSNETYLGLTDEDFGNNPDRRYGVSESDGFDSDHTQAQLFYQARLTENLLVNSKAYIHRFDRTWRRVNGFANCINNELDPSCLNIRSVLLNPQTFTQEYALLSGAADSNPEDARTQIDLRTNARAYGSQGVSLAFDYAHEFGGHQGDFNVSVGYHQDYVERRQRSQAVLVEAGQLGTAVDQSVATDTNDGSAQALSLTISEKVRFDSLSIEAVGRLETIDYETQDFLAADTSTQSASHTLFSPSLGASWELDTRLDQLILIAGIAKGFSAPSASASDDVDPEEALNTELGVRLAHQLHEASSVSFSAIAFASDYENLLGRCRDSDTSCDLGDETSAGEAFIYGIELSSGWSSELTDNLLFTTEFDYTYTDSEFSSSFTSTIPGLRNVRAGDELTYRPRHQASLLFSFELERFTTDLRLKGLSSMREVAGQGEANPQERIPSLATADLVFGLRASDNINLKFIVENIADTRKTVSRRPLGARPNAPRVVKLNMSYQF